MAEVALLVKSIPHLKVIIMGLFVAIYFSVSVSKMPRRRGRGENKSPFSFSHFHSLLPTLSGIWHRPR